MHICLFPQGTNNQDTLSGAIYSHLLIVRSSGSRHGYQSGTRSEHFSFVLTLTNPRCWLLSLIGPKKKNRINLSHADFQSRRLFNLSYPISATDLLSYEYGNKKLQVNSFFKDGTILSACEGKKKRMRKWERKDKEKNLMI